MATDNKRISRLAFIPQQEFATIVPRLRVTVIATCADASWSLMSDVMTVQVRDL